MQIIQQQSGAIILNMCPLFLNIKGPKPVFIFWKAPQCIHSWKDKAEKALPVTQQEMNCAHESLSYRETQETPTSLKGQFKLIHRFFLRPALIFIHLHQSGLWHAYSCLLLQSNRLIKYENVNDCNHSTGLMDDLHHKKTVWTQRNDPN